MEEKALQRARCRRLFCWSGMTVLAGLGYAFFCMKTGWFVPCIFRFYTGYRCPGCGISHMCLALLQLHVREAFWYNPVLFFMLPVLLIGCVQIAVQYIKYGYVRLSRGQNIILSVLLATLIIFGIIRNLVGI